MNHDLDDIGPPSHDDRGGYEWHKRRREVYWPEVIFNLASGFALLLFVCWVAVLLAAFWIGG